MPVSFAESRAAWPHGSEVTPEPIYRQRRNWLRIMAAGAAGTALVPWAAAASPASRRAVLTGQASKVEGALTLENRTSYQDATQYNNFYEFGTDKADPARYARSMPAAPWSVQVEGMVHKPRTFGLEELLRLNPMEERVYRLRCVEGWSMVIPWVGYSLSALLRAVEPLGSAKFVEFVSLADPHSMRGLQSRVLDWPYTEGLRLDEAMHPLTLLAFGMYGEVLPHQNGAPVRLVVPWKYGFKSAKSIVKIRLLEQMPATAWNKMARHEYGFYSNVNPEVAHPRWSQSTERRLGEAGGLFAPKRKTLLFNGYAEQVAHLYAGMDLRRNF